MFTVNPFAQLAISPVAMQTYVVIMFLLVVAGVMSLSYRQEAVYESKLRLIVPEVPIAPGVAAT